MSFFIKNFRFLFVFVVIKRTFNYSIDLNHFLFNQFWFKLCYFRASNSPESVSSAVLNALSLSCNTLRCHMNHSC